MSKEISCGKIQEFMRMIWSQMNHILNQIFVCNYELFCGKFCIHSNSASVVGCKDWPSTRGLEVERIHDRLMVKCIATQETTEYVCKHSIWEGRKLNCTQGGHECYTVALYQITFLPYVFFLIQSHNCFN